MSSPSATDSYKVPPPTPQPAEDSRASMDAIKSRAEEAGAVASAMYAIQQAGINAAKTHAARVRESLLKAHADRAAPLRSDADRTMTHDKQEVKNLVRLRNEYKTQYLGQNGLVNERLIPNQEMRLLVRNMGINSDTKTEIGRGVRNAINKVLLLTKADASPETLETMRLSLAAALGADKADADGRPPIARSLLHVAAVTLDIGLGFVPLASSINDATQIIAGAISGYDYTGNRMKAGDYLLRGIGVAIGFVPAASPALRFGEFVLERSVIAVARAARNLEPYVARAMATSAARILTNEIGAIGSNLRKAAFYRQAFADDAERFLHMMETVKHYNDEITVANRKLVQHSGAAGFDSSEALMRIYRTESARNALAEEVAFNMIKEGRIVYDFHRSLRVTTIDYVLVSGHGIRFDYKTGRFITFISPGVVK